MKVTIISPALPPMIDGIGDHTALLAAELSKSVQVTVLTTNRKAVNPIENVRIISAFDPDGPQTCWKLLDFVKQEPPDWIFLQYNPFGYGRKGLNLTLPVVIRAMQKTCPASRIALMTHERYVPFQGLKFSIMTIWQRWQFHFLSKSASLALFSIEPWAQDHKRQHPQQQVCHLPVGSNVPLEQISKNNARDRLDIQKHEMVIGIFGAMHPSRLLPWILEAVQAVVRAGICTRVLYVGPHPDLVRAAMPGLTITADGPLSPSEVSRRLHAIDIFASPFSDGVSTRRGSFLAALQHGLPTVGTVGVSTDNILLANNRKAYILTPDKSKAAFIAEMVHLAADDSHRKQLAKAARALYYDAFSWPKIGSHLLARLNGEQSGLLPRSKMQVEVRPVC